MTVVVLASASPVRRRLLEDAGVAVFSEPAFVDEGAVKESLRAEGGSAERVAVTLAEIKALRVAARYPGALVIGVDQMLESKQRWFDKPESLAVARAQLQALRGEAHTLTSSAVVVRDGAVIWRCSETARLTMRPFSDAFLEDYLARAGETVCSSVGGYRIEERGIQLFSRIEGDHAVILGIPLLALLGFLREHGVIGR